MRIDKTHRSWMWVSAAILALATTAYIPYASTAPNGPSGGTTLGIVYGVVGYGFMLFAGLLGARKKVPIWRIGRAQTWMRGHLWLGLLSFPLILFHAGFAWRGALTAVMMALFSIVVLSGIVGAALQHYLPRLLTGQVPMETIYEEIPHVRSQLREEAEQLAERIGGPLNAGDLTEERSGPAAQGTVLVDAAADAKVHFRQIYRNSIQPFLAQPDAAASEMARPGRSGEIFESLRRILPPTLHASLGDLEALCEEERQLTRQARLYRLLHAWLTVHVPLSIALLVLGAIHAIAALRY